MRQPHGFDLGLEVSGLQLALDFRLISLSANDGRRTATLQRNDAAPRTRSGDRAAEGAVPAVPDNPELPAEHAETVGPTRSQKGRDVSRMNAQFPVAGDERPRLYVDGE